MERWEEQKTHSFGNHSTPAFIKGPFHDGVVGTGWTRPDNKGVRHVQPIYIDAQIRLWALAAALWRKHPKPNSARPNWQTQLRTTSSGKLGNWVVDAVASDLSQAKRRHGRWWSRSKVLWALEIRRVRRTRGEGSGLNPSLYYSVGRLICENVESEELLVSCSIWLSHLNGFEGGRRIV